MNNKLKGGVIVFLGACSFGLLSTIVKKAYGEGYDLGEVVGSQSFFGMLILWICYFIQSRANQTKKEDQKKVRNNPKTVWWKVAAAGTFTGLVSVFYYKCVSLIPASIAIILLMQYLWISIILDAVIFRKKPTAIQLIAAAIVFMGTILAGGMFNSSIQVNFAGIAYGMLAALCYALFILTSGRIGNDLPVFKKSALMITGACIIIWIIFRPTFCFDGVLVGGLYKWGIILALLGTVIPPALFSYGMPRVGVSLGALLSAAELPVAVSSSYFILQENVELLQWLGVALILLAIAFTNVPVKVKKNEKL